MGSKGWGPDKVGEQEGKTPSLPKGIASPQTKQDPPQGNTRPEMPYPAYKNVKGYRPGAPKEEGSGQVRKDAPCKGSPVFSP